MVGVADELRRQDRYAEELLLREQIVQTPRRNLGVHHEGTLEAEAKLGRCLIDLDRTEEAEPLLTHVVAASGYSPGTMSPDTCLAMVCLAVVHREAGRHWKRLAGSSKRLCLSTRCVVRQKAPRRWT
jgi:hypothetical protein